MVTPCFGVPTALMPERPNDRWQQLRRQPRVPLCGQMRPVGLEIVSADAAAGDLDDLDAAAAQPRHDRCELRLLVALAQPARIEAAAERAEQHDSGPVPHRL